MVEGVASPVTQVPPGHKAPPGAFAGAGGGMTAIVDWRGSSTERVAQIQRARIHAAMAEACVEHGVASVTVADVVRCAGVSRRTFYELFENYEECLLSTLQDGVGRARPGVEIAFGASGKWRERVRGALTTLIAFLEEEPVLGRLLVLEWQAAGLRALEIRALVLNRLVEAVDEGRLEPGADRSASDLTAEGVVGAVLSVIQGRMLRGEMENLSELVNPLMRLIVLPYLGPAAARRELDRPTPLPPPTGEGSSAGNPLKDVEMRLTYRTVQVLTAIADNPASSNRAVGDASGIADQGQVSKILTRLKRLQLVQNVGVGPGQGQPNAWTLTTRGQQLANAFNAET